MSNNKNGNFHAIGSQSVVTEEGGGEGEEAGRERERCRGEKRERFKGIPREEKKGGRKRWRKGNTVEAKGE